MTVDDNLPARAPRAEPTLGLAPRIVREILPRVVESSLGLARGARP